MASEAFVEGVTAIAIALDNDDPIKADEAVARARASMARSSNDGDRRRLLEAVAKHSDQGYRKAAFLLLAPEKV